MRCCLECGKEFRGRADKKYCSDECRASFNDRIYRERRKAIAHINKILLNNYVILKECLENGIKETNAFFLLKKGFDFTYFTTINGRCRENGTIWIGCYSISYSINDNGTILIRSTPQ